MIDRGEGHPANRVTEAPEPRPRPKPIEGMAALAEACRAARLVLGHRLVVEHGTGVMEAVSAWSPRPSILPDPRPDPEGGPVLAYVQVEFHPVARLVPGEWRLVRDGEIVTGGCLSLPDATMGGGEGESSG